MNRKMLPVLFMLISGAIACISTFIHDYSALEKLVTLLVVIVIFGALGSLLQRTMDYFDKQNAKRQEEQERLEAEAAQAEAEVHDKQEKATAQK